MPRPVRVLHIVGAMNPGGVETWLMGLLRRVRRDEVAMDVVVHSAKPGAFDEEVRELGARLIPCPSVRSARYAMEFDDALSTYGPYDVVHSHVHWFSGLTTTLARRRGVPLRIAHSHSDTRGREPGALRAVYRTLMRTAIFRSATHMLAASEPAADSLFGPDWRRVPRVQVLYCGVDLAPFTSGDALRDRESARREFGIEKHEVVVGHVGSLYTPKNHVFLALIARQATSRNRNVRVLAVGTGPMEQEIKRQFEEAGVRAIFTGARRDVPRLLRAMDVFVFPSIYEGLPLALVEAQAAGLPSIASMAITREVDVVPGLVRWLPLSAGADVWAGAVLSAAGHPQEAARGLAAVRQSPFAAESSLANLKAVYLN